MRTLEIGTRKYTEVQVLDEKGQGNANHRYGVFPVGKKEPLSEQEAFHICLAQITFQNGPIKETGVNGVMNEDLIAIVIDRMEGFQSGPYECEENQTALQHLRDALEALGDRTAAREKRGVEGTHEI